MKETNAIEVRNITKKFKIYYDKGNTLKEKTLFRKRRAYEDRNVLNGISFDVEKGKAIGLIGHNGCGKSTTLKLLSKIMYPDSGSIEMKGRVSSLIELGAGFHPDMSGRENIYINASIFGLTKKEINNRLEDIIAFSELEEYIDNPVRTYSSGMYMRLAFAVAINVDADILLIDEILAVGDANFQAKCYNRLREIKASGVTVVLVTHDTGVVERFCDQALWINEGTAVASGKSVEVVDAYLRFMNKEKITQLEKEEKRRKEKEEKLKKEKEEKLKKEKEEAQKNKTEEELLQEQAADMNVKHFGTGAAVIRKAELLDKDRKETKLLRAGEDYFISFDYERKKTGEELVFGMGIYTLENVWIFGTNTMLGKVKVPVSDKEGRVVFHGKELSLLTGEYILQVSITDLNGTPVDFYREYCKFNVVNDKRDAGLVCLPNEWET